MDIEQVGPQFEQEVTKISMEIEQRRNKLEKEAGIESHDKIAKEVIGEAIREAGAKSAASAAPAPAVTYLDATSAETAREINQLIDMIKEKGLTAAVAEAGTRSPYILDVFHDALVEKLYATLKTANYI